MACNDSGLAVISVSNPMIPGAPVYRGLTGNAWGIAVSGQYAYVACSDNNLAVIDVSKPSSPGVPVYRSVIDTAYDVAVADNRAYLACDSAGLAIIAVSNPASPGVPLYRNSTSLTMDARYVTIVQTQVYLGAGYLHVVDITNPANPDYLGVFAGVIGSCGSHVALGPT